MSIVNNETDHPQMTREQVDLSTYKENKELGNHIPLILQLKGFNRQERILLSLGETKNQKAGQTTERKISTGGIALVSDLSGIETINSQNIAYERQFPDSRGICADEDTIYVGTVDKVEKIDTKTGVHTSITSPDFAFIHSVNFSPDHHKILVTSSGFEKIIELDRDTGNVTWEWSARNHDPRSTLGRQEFGLKKLKEQHGGLGLPPGERLLFPNSSLYYDDETILATLFHGGLVKINKGTGALKQLIPDLSHPHGIKQYKNGYILSNTGNESYIILNDHLEPIYEASLSTIVKPDEDIPFKPWLQQVTPLDDHLLGVVDSGRATIFVVDPDKKEVRKIPFANNWVIQEICPINGDQLAYFQSLKN